MYIRKSTAVWLFNEGERLPSDRLFRIRNTQPFNTMAAEDKQASKELNVSDIICIGDICTFHIENEIKVGKTLQFAYFREKRKVAREYKQKTASVNDNDIGVVCTWYYNTPGTKRTFKILPSDKT